MRLMCIHAHFDDYEFVASGTFERIRAAAPESVTSQVLICTDGAAGHHSEGLDQTRERRWAEQQASAKIGGYAVERLRLPNGALRSEANPVVDRPFLAALWKAIRAFEPDYLFVPPIPHDPLAGVHVDHLAVAEAVRQVAYMINVPHAYIDLFPDDPVREAPCKVPVILNTYDAYMAGSNPFDFVVDISLVFEAVAAMSWCHQSQIMEWLPWVGRHAMDPPKDFEAWRGILRQRCERQNRELGVPVERPVEAFMVTGWGELPTPEQLQADFVGLDAALSPFANLKNRLKSLG